MAITQIQKGQKDWLSTLNSNLSQIGTGTEWVKAGLTSLNGFGGTNLCWRKYKAGGLTLIEFAGWCTTAAVKSNQSIDIVQVSDDIKNLVGTYFAQVGTIADSPASSLQYDHDSGRIAMKNGYSFDLNAFGSNLSLVLIF